MTSRRWLLLSGAAVLATSLIGPRIVPLYDGIGFPDEPYRYVKPPASDNGFTVVEPTTADRYVKAQSLKDYNQSVTSGETGPQIAVTLDVNAMTLPDSAGGVDVKAVPQAPSDQPPGGQIAGNVYAVTITSDSGQARFNNANIFVSLRFPQDVSKKYQPAMVYSQGAGKWTVLATEQIGADIYQSGFQGLGQYAIESVSNPAAAAAPQSTGKQRSSLLLVTGLAIAAILIIVFAVRISGYVRNKKHDNPHD